MWFPISHNNAPITVYICSLVRGFFFRVEMLGSIWEAGHGEFKNSVWPRLCSIASNEVPSELRCHDEDMFKHEVHSLTHSTTCLSNFIAMKRTNPIEPKHNWSRNSYLNLQFRPLKPTGTSYARHVLSQETPARSDRCSINHNTIMWILFKRYPKSKRIAILEVVLVVLGYRLGLSFG